MREPYKAYILPVLILAGALLLMVLATLIISSPVFAAGDATTAPGETCPNEGLEGFREVLAECRGFEMVTPPYKAGEAPNVLAISADGSHVLTGSLGTYAGRENGSGANELLGSPYLVGRGESGWSSLALSPPSTIFPAQEYLAASPDLSRTLWKFRSASAPLTAEDLYLREADGTFVKVGSFVPPADDQGPAAGESVHFFGDDRVKLIDASSDLSHVLFSIAKGPLLWPFDTTIPDPGGHSSLYEYTGTGAAQPALVGVSDGKTVLNGLKAAGAGPESVSEVLPAGRLISDCETTLGSQEQDGYNAMSTDGKVVYFTALGFQSLVNPNAGSECEGEIEQNPRSGAHAPRVTELYARLNGTQTTAISEPTPEECEGCQTSIKRYDHKAVTEHPAEFAGASADGSKAFFMTEQELFPGEMGLNLYEFDFDMPTGAHVLPVSSVAGVDEANVLGVVRVSADGSHVYFVDKGKPLVGNANEYGRTAKEHEPNPNLYVFIRNAAHPTGELVFITTLSPNDSHDWEAKDDLRDVGVTPDGRDLVFVSHADLTPDDLAPEVDPQVFEYDSESGELVRVSAGQSGYLQGMEGANKTKAQIRFQDYAASGGALGPTLPATSLALSEDGSTVAFSSKAALTEAATRGAGVSELSSSEETNVYEFHSAGPLSTGKVYLVAPRTNSLEGTDASGVDVFFRTAQELVSSDGDDGLDLYDARIEGGVPVAVHPASCSGEGCLGTPGEVPAFGAPGSVSLTGSGNLAPAPPTVPANAQLPKPKPKAAPERCKKGTTRKRGRCVKSKADKSVRRKGGK
jgi:hypothetical protein